MSDRCGTRKRFSLSPFHSSLHPYLRQFIHTFSVDLLPLATTCTFCLLAKAGSTYSYSCARFYISFLLIQRLLFSFRLSSGPRPSFFASPSSFPPSQTLGYSGIGRDIYTIEQFSSIGIT